MNRQEALSFISAYYRNQNPGDAGKLLSAKIKRVETKGSFKMVKIKIYLIDF